MQSFNYTLWSQCGSSALQQLHHDVAQTSMYHYTVMHAAAFVYIMLMYMYMFSYIVCQLMCPSFGGLKSLHIGIYWHYRQGLS